jgi:hypothetical protein
MPHNLLSGAIYPVIGQHERAVEEGREAVRLKPDSPIPYVLLMFSYITLNRLNEAKATYGQAVARKFDYALFYVAFYEIAFLQNDAAGMAQQVAGSAGKPGVEDVLLDVEAETAAYSGRLRDAREFFSAGGGFRRTSTSEGSCRNLLCPIWSAGGLVR